MLARTDPRNYTYHAIDIATEQQKYKERREKEEMENNKENISFRDDLSIAGKPNFTFF